MSEIEKLHRYEIEREAQQKDDNQNEKDEIVIIIGGLHNDSFYKKYHGNESNEDDVQCEMLN